MTCSLISISTDAEKLIAKIARVSNPKNQSNDNIAGLLRYCVRNKHWSIFEQGSMTIEIKTSRAISAQLLRHRSFCFQEFSQRYGEVDMTPVMPELRRQDIKNRQNSIDDIDDLTKLYYKEKIQTYFEEGEKLYREMLGIGVAKECARMVLPLSSPTVIYMTGNIRSWIHYIEVRSDPSTQLEHRVLAEEIKQIFIRELPIISESMGWK